MQFGSQDSKGFFRMIGYYRLWEAMALEPVEELSDDGGAPQRSPPKPKSKAKAKGKSSPSKPKPKTKPKSSPNKTKPHKRPATADPPSQDPKAKAKPEMKRPAAAASPAKEKVKVSKGFYQRDNKYGFKVNGREVFYVA